MIRRGARGRWIPVSLVFSPDESDDPECLGRFDGAWTVHRMGGPALACKLAAGDRIRPLTARFDGSGRVVITPDTEAETLVVRKPAKLQLRTAPLDPGRYELGYTAVDAAGHAELRAVPVTLEP
jgi:hypothetical protein